MYKIFFALLSLIIATNTFAQGFEYFPVSNNAGIRTDRRPISVGFYDSAVNKTFISWMGSFSNPVVKAYDHSSKTWSEDKIVGASPFADSHNYPGMVQAKDGKLLVFYGCHNSPLKLSSSPTPNSISGDWNDRNIEKARGASYPVPIVTNDGTIYCFFRITMKKVFPDSGYETDFRPHGFVKSTDNGKSWSDVRIIINNFPRNDHLNEVYAGKHSYQYANDSVSERIHIAWTIAGGGPSMHKHALYRRNVYYAYFELESGRLFDVLGNDLGEMIDDSEAENNCKVIDTGSPPDGKQMGYQVSVHFCDSGLPIIIYRHEDNFQSAYWDGSQWQQSVIYTSPNEPREIEKVGDTAFRTYRTAGKSVYIFRTEDRGENWELENKTTTTTNLSRCYVIDNFHPDLKYLLTENLSNENVEFADRDVIGGCVSELTGIKPSEPDDIQLFRNYPNPFNPSTTIQFRIPSINGLNGDGDNVSLAVFNTLGQEVATLVNETLAPGNYTVKFDASHLTSGVYLARLTVGKFSRAIKLLYLR